MKIAHFSLLSSLLLLLLASILSGSLYLGWHQHGHQSAQRQTYEQIRQAVAQEAHARSANTCSPATPAVLARPEPRCNRPNACWPNCRPS